MERGEFGMPALIENRTLGENIALCRRLGLDFLELNMNLPEYRADRLWEERERFLDAAREAGIFYTIHLDERTDIAGYEPRVRAAYLDTIFRTIDAAKAFLPLLPDRGAGRLMVINMHMDHGVYFTLPEGKRYLYGENREGYLEAFRGFRELVRERIGESGILVCVENTDGFLPWEEEAIALLLESPCFALTWDIGHSFAAGERDVPFLTRHSDRIRHMHVHDAVRGTEGRKARDHMVPGRERSTWPGGSPLPGRPGQGA